MKFPGSDWVHPWARACRRSQVIRLSAPVQPSAGPKPEWERLAEELLDRREPAVVTVAKRHARTGILDAIRPPRDPDPLVFGEHRENLSDPNWPARFCVPCQVAWAFYAGNRCWNCGCPSDD